MRLFTSGSNDYIITFPLDNRVYIKAMLALRSKIHSNQRSL